MVLYVDIELCISTYVDIELCISTSTYFFATLSYRLAFWRGMLRVLIIRDNADHLVSFHLTTEIFPVNASSRDPRLSFSIAFLDFRGATDNLSSRKAQVPATSLVPNSFSNATEPKKLSNTICCPLRRFSFSTHSRTTIPPCPSPLSVIRVCVRHNKALQTAVIHLKRLQPKAWTQIGLASHW